MADSARSTADRDALSISSRIVDRVCCPANQVSKSSGATVSEYLRRRDRPSGEPSTSRSRLSAGVPARDAAHRPESNRRRSRHRDGASDGTSPVRADRAHGVGAGRRPGPCRLGRRAIGSRAAGPGRGRACATAASNSAAVGDRLPADGEDLHARARARPGTAGLPVTTWSISTPRPPRRARRAGARTRKPRDASTSGAAGSSAIVTVTVCGLPVAIERRRGPASRRPGSTVRFRRLARVGDLLARRA